MLGAIFVREWLTVPRRARHYAERSAYLGVLWVLGLTAWQATVGWNRTATLGETARFGQLLFQLYAFFQLGLLLFFAAVSAAIAITQEKDRRTFILLLLTDLRNHEIVLGKLFGSLLQIGLFVAGTVPVLALLLLLGGVAPLQVAQATLIFAATGLAAGSLGGLIALWRDQTFQTLALTVLCIVLYLCLVRALALVPLLLGVTDVTAWNHLQLWLDPFQAMLGALEVPADYAWPVGPAVGFAFVMLGWSVLLNGWGIWRLRVWNPSGEPIMQREQPTDKEEKDRVKAHAAPGTAREVWANPILWREVRTRAYGRRPLLVKLVYLIVTGLVCYYALSLADDAAGRTAFVAAYGLVPVAILSLLLLCAQAVTAITSERDRNALDLLLVTDLTPKEFIFGKLGGIATNAWLFLLPPLALAVVYASQGLLASVPRGHPELLAGQNIVAAVCASGTLLVLMAFTTVLGLHVGLRNEVSRMAVVNTLGTVFFLSVGTLVCIYLIVINGRFEYQWGSFTFFLAAGWGGLWWVLNGDRPSSALTLASFLCPVAMFYSVLNVLIGKPGLDESSDPVLPSVVIAGAFGLAIAAMLVPLLSEFDVALGRTTGGE
ncbi:MAG: ABC transporter permease [Gemmataceae bacterium]|nr:ABC transporter permease [Gemmataceae bacterium]